MISGTALSKVTFTGLYFFLLSSALILALLRPQWPLQPGELQVAEGPEEAARRVETAV